MKRVLLSAACFVLLVTMGGFHLNPRNDQDEKEKKSQGWLGVSIQDVTSRLAKQKNLKTQDGAFVAGVEEDSPAETAGFEKGDVVVEFSGKAIVDADDLTKAVRKTEPGTKTTATVMRNGEKKTLQVTTGKPPKSHAFAFTMPRVHSPAFKIFREGGSLGLQLRELTPQLGQYFGAPDGEGVLVEEVKEKSAGEKAGMKAGDIVLKVGKRTINDIQDVLRALDRYREDGKAEVLVLRKGNRTTLNVELEADDEDADGAGRFRMFPHDGSLQEFEVETAPELPEIQIEKRLDGFEKSNRIRKFRIQHGGADFLKSI